MKLYRSFATVGGLTLVSRVFGFMRDILLARLLGTGPVADAFVIAFRFPNLFRRLFGEGAFNSAFVPLFAGRLEREGPSAAREFAEEAMAGLLLVLLVLSALCMIAMPWLMLVLAPGFAATPEKFDLAVVMSQARWLERSLWPYLVALQAIPILAVVPIIAPLMGYELKARVLVCVIISFFPIVSNTLFGLLSADVGQHDLFTLRGASRWTRLRKLQLPAAMPAVFTGFRIAAGLSVIGAVVGELFFRRGDKGIGILMDQYRSRNQYPEMYGALVLSVLLGIVVFTLFGWLAKVAVGRWHESTRKTG